MPLQIVLLSKHPAILQTLVKVINNNKSWHAQGTSCPNAALQLCKSNSTTLVILGNGLSTIEEHEFTTALHTFCPNTKVLQHYGGGSGLIHAEILQAVTTPAAN
jgi:DNA-binding NarL/FixJ family response regulator